jgi:carbon storage regulator
MLVLSRKIDESIIIDNTIVVTVIDIRDGKCRLGIAAPIEISVHREEVQRAIQRQKDDPSYRPPPIVRGPRPLPPRFPTKDLTQPPSDGSPAP